MRDNYGRNSFGQSCLVARRLVEQRRALRHHQLQGLGHAQAALPDHEPQAAGNGPGHGRAPAGPLRPQACSTRPSSGGAASSGELRKSPGKRRGTAAGSHWGSCFSVVLAGGGFKGGQVVGSLGREGRARRGAARLAAGPARQHPGDCWESIRRPLPNDKGLDVKVMPSSESRQGRRQAEGDNDSRFWILD